MDRDSGGRCAPRGPGVWTQRPWRRLVRHFTLSKQTSRTRERCRASSPWQGRWGSGEDRGSGSSSEELCSIDQDVPLRVNERLTCIGCNKRRPSFSDTESVLDIGKMPVGTAGSVLKSSFSLTSLRSSNNNDSPEHGAATEFNAERPYHSLTKKSRQGGCRDKEQWRKSWGSGISQDGKEFWEGFQADYDYLMAQSILERDAGENGADRGTPGAPPMWSHSEFMDHFAQLYSWLKSVQDAVCGTEDHGTPRKSRAEGLEDMQRQRCRLERLREESRRVVGRWPEAEAEVLRRVRRIGEEWERVEAMVRGGRGERGSKEEVEREMRGLRNWLRELDGRLKPLTFRRRWTRAELEIMTKEHMVLHRDIEGHRKTLSSLLKLCEVESPKALAAARALERKYHLYYLRSLEWQCHIESLVGQHNKGSSNVISESDGEPVPKVARFAWMLGAEQRYEGEESADSDGVNSDGECLKDDDCRMSPMSPMMEDKRTSLDTVQPAVSVTMGAREHRNPNGSGGRGSTLGPESKIADAALSCAKQSATHAADAEREHRERSVSAAPEQRTNRPKEKPPNTGMFTLRHLDTDSEQEKAMPSESRKGETSAVQDADTTSSEGGWTYRSSNGVPKIEGGVEKPKAAVRLDFKDEEAKQMKHFSAKNIPLVSSQELISSSKLVEFADELLRWKTGRARKGRRGRTRRRKNLDSCDASGENTDDESAGKHRPLSITGVPWPRAPRSHGWKSRTSVSESALHQMSIGADEGGSVSARKRRARIRKLAKKSESGSDALTLSGSDSSFCSGRQVATLVKSGSFSGVSRRQRGDGDSESETEEETQRLLVPVFRLGPTEGAVTVAVEQDKGQAEEQHSLNWDSYQEKYQSEAFSEEPLDSDTAKRVLEFGEDYSKFLGNQSDSASARNLTFGNRGRYKVDSDSDVSDVRQTLRQSLEQLELWEIKFNKTIGGLLSGSDVAADDCVCRTFLDEIIGACKRNVECLSKLLVEVKEEMFLAKEHEDVMIVSHPGTRSAGGGAGPSGVEDDRTHSPPPPRVNYRKPRKVYLVDDAMASVLGSLRLGSANMVSVQVQTDHVKDSWENLKSTAELHKAKQLRTEMAVLRDELLSLAARADAAEASVVSREELEAKITQVQNELNLMKKGKNRLLQVNVSVHRFLASAKQADAALKDEVTELYQLREQTFCRVSSLLSNLQGLSQTWHDFEDHLAQLQCALRTDTLRVLDFALKRGAASGETSLSLQDIAGILSDRAPDAKDSLKVPEPAPHGKPSAPSALATLNTEGSLSDSGISDSGSEQELSEREKRLAQLKKLAKRLETILAPGSQALSNMFKRIEQAESELRELQKTCRDLIVRSASTEEIRMIVASTPTLGNLDLDHSPVASPALPSPASPRAEKQSKGAAKSANETAAECEGAKPAKKFWLWRLLCYALPFQLALVAVLCLAGMLEPRCCDSLNNLDLSLHPQLRYDSGPPPV